MPALCVVLSVAVTLAASLHPAAADAVLADFADTPLGQQPPGWKLRGTNGYASQLTVQQDQEEQQCAVLRYDFAAEQHRGGWLARGARKTVIMGCWLRIPDDHWVLEVDLTGDASGHGLVLSVGEPNREWFNFDLGRVDFDGKRTLRVDLATDWRDSSGPQANKQMEPPLWLASLNLEQRPQGPQTGRIAVHEIHALAEESKGLSALSPRWLLPQGGVFTTDDADSVSISLQNISQQDLAGGAVWQLTCQGQPLSGAEQDFLIPARAQSQLSLSLREVCVGYYDVDLQLTSGDASRTFRTSLAIVPELRTSKTGLIGAGPTYLPLEDAHSYALLMAAMRWLGVSWTIAIADFSAFEDDAEAASRQRDVLQAGCAQGLDIWVSLRGMPKELAADSPELIQRYGDALSRAAECFSGETRSWVIRSLDGPPTPPSKRALTNYAALLADASAKLPDGRLVGWMPTTSLMQLAAYGDDVVWPDRVGLLTDDLMVAENEAGAIARRAEDLVQRLDDAGIDADLRVQLHARPVQMKKAALARQYAEGLVRTVTEAVYGLPRTAVFCSPLQGYTEPEALFTSDGTVTPVGVAFAICTHLLDGVQPHRELQLPDARGYLFTCEGDSVAMLWPEPLEAEVRLPIEVRGTVSHYGAVQQYDDVTAGASEVVLRPGANLLKGDFEL